jgi:DNA-binding transcriptional MerR regulator
LDSRDPEQFKFMTSDNDRIRRRPRADRRAARIEFLESVFSGFGHDVGPGPATDSTPPSDRSTPIRPATGSRAITGLYIISVAARLSELHPQTLRKYERFGLVSPSRSGGSLRLYSEEDLVRLRLIRNLTERFDLNLAGVKLVMALVERIRRAVDLIETDAPESFGSAPTTNEDSKQDARPIARAVEELKEILETLGAE